MNGLSPRAGRAALLPILFIVATLYFARDFFLPLALAILISFLLAPVVRRFERWGLGRVTSVIGVTILAFLALGGLVYVIGGQLIDLANDLDSYKAELHEKVQALKTKPSSPLGRASQTLKEITAEIASDEPATTAPTGAADPRALKEIAPVGSPQSQLPSHPLATPKDPVPVAVVYTPGNAFQTLKEFAAPLLAPLGTAAIVIVFVIFMLLGREDLRDRIIHLVGRGHLQVTTTALDDAALRVSRYLLAQLIVNVTYGIPIGVGLWLIGIPNAILWGILATVLRFVPYIGPWIAASFPILLSLAITPGWKTPLLTIGLFVVIEIISNNFVEPWLYGSRTGLSPMAIIVAAAFWTWLWGAIGLLLATPLTVCIAVLGRYIPNLSFLDVLLGDKPPIAPEDRFYQRLLAMDEEEVTEIAEKHAAAHSLAETYDHLVIPALRLSDEDFLAGLLDEARRCRMLEVVKAIVIELGECGCPTPPKEIVRETASILIIPAGDLADEVVGCMLAQLLRPVGVAAHVIPSKLLASEMIDAVDTAQSRQLCISVLPPGSTRQAIYVTKRLRDRFPDARILIGLWGEPPGDDRRIKRIRRTHVDAAVTTLADAVKDLAATAAVALPAESPVETAAVAA